MSWSDEDDLFENEKSKKIQRKSRKQFERSYESRFENEEEGTAYRHKRAGKRSHRKKNPKDEFWPGGDRP